MQLEEVLNRLHLNLKNGLAGWEAQKMMSPPFREKPDMNLIQEQNPRYSAVLLLIYEKDESTHIVLTQRHRYEGAHSGQISFPGGKKERNEALIDTSMRECAEEIGVLVEVSNILTPLSELYIPPSNFLVSPFLAYLPYSPIFLKQESEVASIIEIDLNELFNKENKKDVEVQIGAGQTLNVPAYVINNYVIWGATAAILSEFEQLIQ